MRDRAGQRGIPVAIPFTGASADAHWRRSDRWRWYATCCGQVLCVCRKCGKADGRRVCPEDGVNVLEERIADDPLWAVVVTAAATARRILEDGPETLAVRDLGQFEVIRGDGPCLAAE